MKLNLAHQDGIAVLSVGGAVDRHNFDVLKAGISKLLRAGRNRIALNLEDAQEIDGEVIRELAILDVFARELAGQLVLAAPHDELKEQVRRFATPPVIPIVSTVDQALDFFRRTAPAADPHAASTDDLKTRLAEAERKNASLEKRLALLDPREVNTLRAANASLLEKVKLLEQQVETLSREARRPNGVEGFLEQIAALEESVQRLATEPK